MNIIILIYFSNNNKTERPRGENHNLMKIYTKFFLRQKFVKNELKLFDLPSLFRFPGENKRKILIKNRHWKWLQRWRRRRWKEGEIIVFFWMCPLVNVFPWLKDYEMPKVFSKNSKKKKKQKKLCHQSFFDKEWEGRQSAIVLIVFLLRENNSDESFHCVKNVRGVLL